MNKDILKEIKNFNTKYSYAGLRINSKTMLIENYDYCGNEHCDDCTRKWNNTLLIRTDDKLFDEFFSDYLKIKETVKN